jgi:hypothetical protein
VRWWEELTERQRKVAKVQAVVLGLMLASNLGRPVQSGKPRWITLPAVAVLVAVLYWGRRGASWGAFVEKLTPQNRRRIELCTNLLILFAVAGAAARMALGDNIAVRLLSVPLLVTMGAIIVIGASVPKPESPNKGPFVPWPFKLPPRVPPDSPEK